MKLIKRQIGFSLVELIVVITILAVLSATTLSMIQSGFRAYFTQRNLSNANWQARLALSRMTRDLRDLPSANNMTTATAPASCQLIRKDQKTIPPATT